MYHRGRETARMRMDGRAVVWKEKRYFSSGFFFPSALSLHDTCVIIAMCHEESKEEGIAMKDEELFPSGLPEEEEASGAEEDEVIVLTDEDGNEIEFELCDTVEYEGKQYAVLLPADEESEEVVIMEIEDDPDSEDTLFEMVEDEATIDAVFNLFREQASDLYDFE